MLFVQGRSPRGTLFPALSEFYYGLEAVFLPAIVYWQWRGGSASLAKSGATSAANTAATALFASAACFVVPDTLLVLFGRMELLAPWARIAGPLALMVMLFVLYRAASWPAALRALFWLTLPAILLVR